MTKPVAYLLTVAATLLGVAVAYVGLFAYQLGAPVAAEYWVYEVRIAKLFLAAQTSGRRLFVLSGSNALFGIDSSLLERETGLRTVNLSIHAGLNLPYIVESTRPLLRPRDVVIMPLEFEYYDRAFSRDWFRSNVMAWDPAYFSRLSLDDQARFILAVPTKRVVNGALARLFERALRTRHGRIVRDPDEIAREAVAIWRAKSCLGGGLVAYSIAYLDPHGDMQNNRGTRYTGTSASILSSSFEPAPETWEALERFADYCLRHGVDLFVTWPAIMSDPGLDDGSPIVRRNIEQISERLAKAKVRILGRPRDYTLDRAYFYDTKYHLNEEGRGIRSGQLARDLTEALATDGSVEGSRRTLP